MNICPRDHFWDSITDFTYANFHWMAFPSWPSISGRWLFWLSPVLRADRALDQPIRFGNLIKKLSTLVYFYLDALSAPFWEVCVYLAPSNNLAPSLKKEDSSVPWLFIFGKIILAKEHSFWRAMRIRHPPRAVRYTEKIRFLFGLHHMQLFLTLFFYFLQFPNWLDSSTRQR